MEIKKTPVQIPLTWLHVWLLFAGIYGFAAGFLELTGSFHAFHQVPARQTPGFRRRSHTAPRSHLHTARG